MAAVNPVLQSEEETKFINKLYDDSLSKQKDTLAGNYTQNTGALESEQQKNQAQTQDYLQRTDVEAEKGRQNAPISGLSAGAKQQAGLTLDNQQKRDTSVLQNAQAQADAEVERQRKLLASEYEAAIRQAQADNDMARAQQLYEAAKREEERLRGYRQEAGNALAAKGDYSIVRNLYGLSNDQTQALNAMYTPAAAPEGYTTPEAMKADEEALRRIYDASLEAQNQKLQTEYDRSLSDLQAKQQAQQQKTDQALTDAYVKALKQGKNYNEVQTAYGMGSGAKAQAAIAREAGLQGDLTDLRKLQQGYTAQAGRDSSDLLADLLASRQKAQAESESGFADAMNDAYTDRKNKQLADQEAAGKLLAKNQNDYSILGKLWGLSQDQIDRLQGTGAYAPIPEPSYSYTSPTTGKGTSSKSVLRNPDIKESYLGQGSDWLGKGSDYAGSGSIGWADVVDGAMKTRDSGGNVNAYIQAAKSEGYITQKQAKDLKTNINRLGR